MNIKMLTAILKELPTDTVFKLGFANPHSYRGYYHQLGLEPLDDIKVTTMIEALEDANGNTYHGWKEGEYLMGDETTCYLANEGNIGPMIAGVAITQDIGGSLQYSLVLRGEANYLADSQLEGI
jgi:hypothetical protein